MSSTSKFRAFASTETRKILDEPHFPLAIDRVRYVGEAVVVIAESVNIAKRRGRTRRRRLRDAAGGHRCCRKAIKLGAPSLWSAAPDNIAVDSYFGDRAATEAAMNSADLVVEQYLPQPAHRHRPDGAALGHRQL